MDCYFRQYWRDNRLSFKGLKQTANNVIINQVLKNMNDSRHKMIWKCNSPSVSQRFQLLKLSPKWWKTRTMTKSGHNCSYPKVEPKLFPIPWLPSPPAESEREDAGKDLETRHLLSQRARLLSSYNHQVKNMIKLQWRSINWNVSFQTKQAAANLRAWRYHLLHQTYHQGQVFGNL